MGPSKLRYKKENKRNLVFVTGLFVLVCGAIAFIGYNRCYRRKPIDCPSAFQIDPEMLMLKERRKQFEAYALFNTLPNTESVNLMRQRSIHLRDLNELESLPRNPEIEEQIIAKRKMLASLSIEEVQLDQQRSQKQTKIDAERKKLDSLEREYQQRKNLTPDEYEAGYEIDEQEWRLCSGLDKKSQSAGYDIAALSMALVKGLPGTEKLDEHRLAKKLDTYVARVKAETERHLYRYKQAPHEFANSEAYFRVIMMGTVLQEDFKIRYDPNPEKRIGFRKNDMSFFDETSSIFLYGLLGDIPQGTCASMPVLYVAVGRRLGYPLKLVNAKEHLFARWEDSKQKFNIECTSDKGINCFPDSEYRKWPYRISDAEMRSGMYLRSLTPRQELAMLLNLRAICLKQAGKKNLSLTCKIYADDLLQREGIDLKTVNKGLARSMHADPGFAEAHLKESAVVEIDWVEAKSKEAK